ncbi:hypothetical protein GCM10010991_30520 [Gemmobacter aquaticus]|uniref:Small integral membrane protein n=1 Tax=Gemmobacter aquaticus TaxID=490185 RepID=A0A917YPM2_9RHOB|nr:DUF2160 domain-containing protein [Gemmobacter aquaticus]GGO36473.1 hypothetical protein GCM10010991_30520 [Gemmobacter aquaticus]
MSDTTATPTRPVNWTAISITAAVVMGGILAALLAVAPRDDGGIAWFDPMIPGGWMAWTLPVAIFFWCIASLLVTFTILAIRFPETPRVGVLRIETTRGDRLFISLLGSAFICLVWLFFAGLPVWGALALCLVYAAAVFRWV